MNLEFHMRHTGPKRLFTHNLRFWTAVRMNSQSDTDTVDHWGWQNMKYWPLQSLWYIWCFFSLFSFVWFFSVSCRIFTAIMPMVAAGLIADDPTLLPVRRLLSSIWPFSHTMWRLSMDLFTETGSLTAPDVYFKWNMNGFYMGETVMLSLLCLIFFTIHFRQLGKSFKWTEVIKMWDNC